MKKTDAAVFVLLGQSNAVGHGIPMAEADVIRTPLKNVFGLSRAENQSYTNTSLTWSGYTSGGMNLAEEQDDTYSVANCLARIWQDAADGGAELPDLYIVHIAVGAQGVMPEFMWYPEREPKLIPGRLGTVDIALYPFTTHILSLLGDSFRERGMTYEILGIHWRGSEEDYILERSRLEAELTGIYRRMFAGFAAALGKMPPVILHRIVCDQRARWEDPTGRALDNMRYVNTVFDALAKQYPEVSVFDVREYPGYKPEEPLFGLFMEDGAHFTPAVNRWVAERIWKESLL